MYPVKLGFEEATRRARGLLSNGHDAEALVSAVFTIEKTLRRSLRFVIVARGFTSSQADGIINRAGLQEVRRLWGIFAPEEAAYDQLLSVQQRHSLDKLATMRNRLVHGQRAYKLSECRSSAQQALSLLSDLRGNLLRTLGADGWSRLPVRRKPSLQWMPPKKAV